MLRPTEAVEVHLVQSWSHEYGLTHLGRTHDVTSTKDYRMRKAENDQDVGHGASADHYADYLGTFAEPINLKIYQHQHTPQIKPSLIAHSIC